MKQIILFILMFITSILKSQTPANDPNYVLDTQDDFNSFNTALWNQVPNNTWGLETYSANNVTASGGVLTLKCEKIGNSYISGGIETVNKKSFSYGYFEIESQLPASGLRGPWGGFWMHTGTGGWDEIDVLEPNGCDCEIGTQFRTGWGATYNNILRWTPAKIITGLPNLSTNFHKYAVIWTPGEVKVLFDGNIVREEFEALWVPSHPMSVFLTFQVDAWGCKPNSTTFPTSYWKYKNFKYYKLKTDCSIGITASNFNFLNQDYKVQKFYSLSNSTVPSYSNIILRATDYIELKGGFTVPYGSMFTAITHRNTCPN